MAKYSNWLILFTLFPLWLESAQGYAPLSPEADSLVNRCIDDTFNGNYVEALQICDRLEKLVDSPLATFYRSAILAAEMIDFEDTLGLGQFYMESDKCIDLCQQRINKKQHLADDYFYMGSAYAYQAIFLGHQHQYWTAYRKALKSRKALERCLEMDTSYIDAHVGLGNFKYWMSKKFEILNWLPILKDEKEDGIIELEQAIQKEPRSKYFAISSLATIRLDQGKPTEALRLARLGREKYPESRVFMWAEGAAASSLHLFTISNRIYATLLQSVTSQERNNHFNELSCYVSLVVGYHRLKEWAVARDLALKALNLPLSEEIRERKKGTLTTIRHHLAIDEQMLSKKSQQAKSHGSQ
jgi:tetratricopeptide (TPR) repeat protein